LRSSKVGMFFLADQRSLLAIFASLLKILV
jgi:hypothetical protein